MTVHVKRDGRDFIGFSNLDDLKFNQMMLVKRGYGTLKEVMEMDTTEFLDAIEFESIQHDLELWHIQNPEG